MDVLAIILPALSDAFGLIMQPGVLVYLALGVVMGLAIGVLPGLGGIAGLSLILPFMFGMEPVLGLALMIGMVAVVPTSDTFASVLMGIPGSSASQATRCRLDCHEHIQPSRRRDHQRRRSHHRAEA